MILIVFQIIYYPTIWAEIESRIIEHFYSAAPEQEKKVLELVELEKSFQKTNHEDFKPKKYV